MGSTIDRGVTPKATHAEKHAVVASRTDVPRAGEAKTNSTKTPPHADTPRMRQAAAQSKAPARAGVAVSARGGSSAKEKAQAEAFADRLSTQYAAGYDFAGDSKLPDFLAHHPKAAEIIVRKLGDHFAWGDVIRDTVKANVARCVWPHISRAQQAGVITALAEFGLSDELTHHLKAELNAGRTPMPIIVAAGRAGMSFSQLRDLLPEHAKTELSAWFTKQIEKTPEIHAMFKALSDPGSALSQTNIGREDLELLVAGAVSPNVRDFFAANRAAHWADPNANAVAELLMKGEAAGAQAMVRLTKFEADSAESVTAIESLQSEQAIAQNTVDRDHDFASTFAARTKKES